VNLLPVDEHKVILMLVTEAGKISNTTLNIRAPYSKDKLEFLSKVMTLNYKGKSLSNILTLDIIKNFETDIEAMGRLAENIMPNFLHTLESMLNVELYMDGLTNIFSIPEYHDIGRAKLFLEMINKKKEFTDILINRDSGVIITIGNENTDEVMRDCSLITATYCVDGKCVGKLGVIGPTRMNYREVTSIIEYMTDNLSQAFRLTEGEKDEQ
jgi:heat-inducible transcriptional repressor